MAKSGLGCTTEKQPSTKFVRVRAASSHPKPIDPRKRSATSRRRDKLCGSASCRDCTKEDPPVDRAIDVIQEKIRGPVSAASETNQWEEHIFTLDSGACDHVCADSSLAVPTVLGDRSMKGVAYEVANGDEIPNLGEKRCVTTTDESAELVQLAMQVCDVHKSLLSVGKIVKAGRRVVFDSEHEVGHTSSARPLVRRSPSQMTATVGPSRHMSRGSKGTARILSGSRAPAEGAAKRKTRQSQ